MSVFLEVGLLVESGQDVLEFFLTEIRIFEDLLYFYLLVTPIGLIIDHLDDLLLNALILQLRKDLFELELCLGSIDNLLGFFLP